MKAIDIKGLLPEKKGKFDSSMTLACQSSFNQAIDLISQREIGIDREKLARVIYQEDCEKLRIDTTIITWNKLKDKYLDLADAIISALPGLLEVINKITTVKEK